MTMEEMKRRLKYMNLAKVGRVAGVHREVLSQYLRGTSQGFSAATYIKMVAFFEKEDAEKKGSV